MKSRAVQQAGEPPQQATGEGAISYGPRSGGFELILLLSAVACAMLVTACSPVSREEVVEPTSADWYIDEAILAMHNLDSYRLTITTNAASNPPYSAGQWITDFESADRYRVVARMKDPPSAEFCQYPSAHDTDECIQSLEKLRDGSFLESVLVDESLYARSCADSGMTVCVPWAEMPSALPPVSGPRWFYMPEFPLTFLDAVSGLSMESAGSTSTESIHIRGESNLLTALAEAEMRSFGSSAAKEDLESDEGRFYQQNPAAVNVWLNPDFTVSRISVSAREIPPHPLSEQPPNPTPLEIEIQVHAPE